MYWELASGMRLQTESVQSTVLKVTSQSHLSPHRYGIPNQDLAAQMAKSEQENQIPLVDGVKVIHIENNSNSKDESN